MDPDAPYPIRFAVAYPDRELDRLLTLLRPITVLPILFVLGTVIGHASGWGHGSGFKLGGVAGGFLMAGPLLMILFRRKYPRWWFDWNRELLRFANRVGAYMALMDDRYPSTDEAQSVTLEFAYPDVERDLHRWLPLVKWFLAIPHFLALLLLGVAALVAVVLAWFAILFTGRYPRGLFDFVEGVMRWHNRVVGYAILLVTDRYPPFHLRDESSA